LNVNRTEIVINQADRQNNLKAPASHFLKFLCLPTFAKTHKPTKLSKRAKSPSPCNNYVLYHISQVKADLIATNDKHKNYFSYHCSQVKADL